MDSCFVLFGTRQHGVANLNNASERANANRLPNVHYIKFRTLNSLVPRILHYTVLTSSKKNETAVHGCNPTISVLVVLVSHKVYFLCSTISLAVLFVICSSVSISLKQIEWLQICSRPTPSREKKTLNQHSTKVRKAYFYLNRYIFIGYRNNRYFPHTNPYNSKVTQRRLRSHFELGEPVLLHVDSGEMYGYP